MNKVIKYIVNCTVKGFNWLSFILVKGIYFYLYLIVCFFKKFFKNSNVVNNMHKYLQQKPRSAESSLLMFFAIVVILSICELLFFNTNKLVSLDRKINVEELKVSEEIKKYDQIVPEVEASKKYDKSLFKYYGNMELNQINFNELKKSNDGVVGWLIVDGTNINYPIVQGIDNDYYLDNSFNKVKDKTGWPFMDYRNDSNMSNDNTIFYGHNLLNNTSFGSISKIFTNKWYKSSSHKIYYITEDNLYTYEIFSAYYINPESYYLQINLNDDNYSKFISKLKSRSIIKFNVNVGAEDKIITLSTCTNDNTGRKVIHAKLLSQKSY